MIFPFAVSLLPELLEEPLYTLAIERFKNFRTCDHKENDSSEKNVLVQGDDVEAVPDASKAFFATTP